MQFRKPRKVPAPLAIKGLVVDQLQKLGLMGEVQQHQAFLAFAKACGPLLLQHARPERIERGTLYVRVVHSTWIQELTCMKIELLAKIHTFVGGEKVKDLRFLVGPVHELHSFSSETKM